MRGVLFLLILLLYGAPVRAADLTLEIVGVRATSGMMRVALFDSAESFPSGEEAFARDVPATVGTMTVHFADVPAGTYALALHHDENSNGEMDTLLLGIPREGYGFSNDALVFFGPPSFSAAAFDLPDGGRAISVAVRY